MAFVAYRAANARALVPGHRLFLYTTRACFRNPTRHRGRIIGEATVASQVIDLETPLTLAGRCFTVGCALSIPRLAALHTGVELAPLVPELRSFPDPASWGVRMRQTLVPLADADVSVLAELLQPFLQSRLDVLDDYVKAGQLAKATELPK